MCHDGKETFWWKAEKVIGAAAPKEIQRPIWRDAETFLFMGLMKEKPMMFKRSRIVEESWQWISWQLSSRSFPRSWVQCRDKWYNLKASLKKMQVEGKDLTSTLSHVKELMEDVEPNPEDEDNSQTHSGPDQPRNPILARDAMDEQVNAQPSNQDFPPGLLPVLSPMLTMGWTANSPFPDPGTCLYWTLASFIHLRKKMHFLCFAP